MSTHNICFLWIKKKNYPRIITKYSSLISPLQINAFLISPQNMLWVLIRRKSWWGTSNEYLQYVFMQEQEEYQYFLAEKKRIFALLEWTPKIFSSCVIKTSVFSLVLSRSENLNVFITGDKNIYAFTEKKANFLFISLFSCFTASDVSYDIAKQNIMTLTLRAYHKEREREKKNFRKSK